MKASQPDVRQNYFELFELPVGCEIDTTSLRARYMALQREFHPDRYAAADDQHRRAAVQIAAMVNEAHTTLSDPLKRAEYCLSLRGIDTGAETDSNMDSQFLMEQMEWREKLEDLSESEPVDRAQLDSLCSEIKSRINEVADETSAKIGQQDDQGARDLIRKWQFLEKIDAQARAVGAQLDD